MRSLSGTFRVVVVDEDAATRALLRAMLHDADTATMIAASTGSAEDVVRACRHDPDVVLVDRRLAATRGTDLIGDIVRACPRAMIAILSAPGPDEEGATLDAGAFSSYAGETAIDALLQHLARDYVLFRQALEGEDVCAPAARRRGL